jgi:hypothetical protein
VTVRKTPNIRSIPLLSSVSLNEGTYLGLGAAIPLSLSLSWPAMHGPSIPIYRQLGPVYTTVEKASGRSRMLGQDMLI